MGDPEPLAHHRRDVRTAALTHALLLIALIVLFLLNRRFHILAPLEDWILNLL